MERVKPFSHGRETYQSTLSESLPEESGFFMKRELIAWTKDKKTKVYLQGSVYKIEGILHLQEVKQYLKHLNNLFPLTLQPVPKQHTNKT